jgi:hypothetical protein
MSKCFILLSSSLSIIFPHLFLSGNIFLVSFPLQTLFPRLFLSRHIFLSFFHLSCPPSLWTNTSPCRLVFVR